MSLITSCPACGTMFRVVPDQLKISEGWVRCGHCSEVFDASAHMLDESVLEQLHTAQAAQPPEVPPYLAARPPAAPPAAAAPVADAPAQDRAREEEDSSLPPSDFPASSQPATLPVDLATRPASLYGPLPEPPRPGATAFPDSEPLEPSPLDGPFVFRRSDLLEREDVSVLPSPPVASQWPEAHDEHAQEELHDVSFVRQARRRAFWRRPAVRGLLLLAGLVLAALLALQVAWHDRDRLALTQPQLRPALAWMCSLLQCELGPPRQIESLVIESSGFTRVRNDTYRLAFTLRNTARTQVAVPAMELTITDAADQPIARRVLLPAELGAPGEALAPAGEWAGAVGIVVGTSASARVAGYRLLAFYP